MPNDVGPRLPSVAQHVQHDVDGVVEVRFRNRAGRHQAEDVAAQSNRELPNKRMLRARTTGSGSGKRLLSGRGANTRPTRGTEGSD